MKWFILLGFQFLSVAHVKSWNEAPGSVLLRDVQVLTLYKGHYTAARRSSPVPHLQCVGGSAGCGAYVPEVVQCENKGWDGVDAQWECKTDMDNAYRFGRIEVTCEGYSHSNDAYILKGSCGLEYTLELTEEGRGRSAHATGDSRYWFKPSGGFGDFASNLFSGFSGKKLHQSYQGNQQKPQSWSTSAGEDTGSLLGVAVLLLLAYSVYKLFLSANPAQGGQGREQGAYPGEDDHREHAGGPSPPGFKPNFTGQFTGYPGAQPGYGFHNDYSYRQHYPGCRAAPAAGGGSGFWTGLGTGGMLGYLFGRQRNQPFGYNPTQYSDGRPSPAPDQASSRTRTASGFGGTRRR